MKNANGFIHFILLLVIALIVFGGIGYYAFKNGQIKLSPPQKQAAITLTQTPDPTANWKTYRNEKYGFEVKYPQNLLTDFENRGFISGSDYYGKRDFNFLIYDPETEPSVPQFGESPIPSYAYDGYNFAIFSGQSAKNHLKNVQEIVESGKQYSPTVQSKIVNVGGQRYSLYYVPQSDLPNTNKMSFWLLSFPLKDGYTMIVTGNYDQKILDQILSTFRFLDKKDYLVKVSYHGGLCPEGECTSTRSINKEGEVFLDKGVQGKLDNQDLIKFKELIEDTNYEEIKSRKFTGTCPTAYDGQEAIYTFYLESGEQVIASCDTDIDFLASPFIDIENIFARFFIE